MYEAGSQIYAQRIAELEKYIAAMNGEAAALQNDINKANGIIAQIVLAQSTSTVVGTGWGWIGLLPVFGSIGYNAYLDELIAIQRQRITLDQGLLASLNDRIKTAQQSIQDLKNKDGWVTVSISEIPEGQWQDGPEHILSHVHQSAGPYGCNPAGGGTPPPYRGHGHGPYGDYVGVGGVIMKSQARLQ